MECGRPLPREPSLAIDAAGPWGRFAFWIKEGRLCTEDGHYAAACTAYEQAFLLAPTELQKQAAAVLLGMAVERYREHQKGE